jgi:transcriptional regulator with XRE-family HTH domain
MINDSLSNKLGEFLVDSRKKANLSQQAAVDRCSVVTTQKMASRLEARPMEYSLEILQDYIRAIGAKSDEFFKLLATTPSIFKENEVMHSSKYFEEKQVFLKGLTEITKDLESLPEDVRPKKLLDKIGVASNTLSSTFDGAILAIMGPSDSGKSHIINLLMEKNIAPEGFQPMTAACTLFVHESKKPEYLGGDSVVIFKYSSNGEYFNLSKIESDNEEFIIDRGDYSILEEYAARNEDDEILYPDAYLVVVYVDSPVLENISLLDTPGQLIDPDFTADEDGVELDSLDVKKAFEAMAFADGFIFTSSITKFLRDKEPEFFAKILRAPGNEPLDPLFPIKNVTILATQSFSFKNSDDFVKPSKQASVSFHKKMTHLLYDSWTDKVEDIVLPTAEDWQERMIPFWDDNEEFMDEFSLRFSSLVNDINENLISIRLSKLNSIKNDILRNIESEINIVESKRIDNGTRLEEVKEQDARFRREVVGVLEKFEGKISEIDELKQDSKEQIHTIIDSLTSEDRMKSFIEERFSDEKEAKSGLSEAIGQYIERRVSKVISKSSKQFALEIEKIVIEFNSIVPGNRVLDNSSYKKEGNSLKSIDVDSFDSQSAFIGGMTGLASFGAMSAYVATISSNLGAYILVGKAAGVLTSLGITGSVTTLPWLVGATGGPVVWGIAIAAALSYMAFRLFKDWKSSIAKSAVKSLQKNSTVNSIVENVNNYWDDTGVALRHAIDGLTSDADSHIIEMFENAAKKFNPEDLDSAAEKLQRSKGIINL